jgi:prepilin-type N-terminal cleavage/methylation domain-containing protein
MSPFYQPSTPPSPRSRGFTLLELIVALTVIAAGITMLVALMIVARRKTRLQCERQMASALAQGALERLRAVPHAALPGNKPAPQPLPPEAEELPSVKALASTSPWKPEKGLLRLKVVVTWDSRRGGRRQVAREGLISDAREK